MKGILYQNQPCKTLVVTESKWESYSDKKREDLKSDYGTDGNLYILPDWSELAKNTVKYPLDEFGCAKLLTELNKGMFLYDAKSGDLFEKKDLDNDPSRETQGMYWRKDVNSGILNEYTFRFADEIRHVCKEVLCHPTCPKGVQKDEHDEVVKAIDSLRNLLWNRYKIFSNYAKNKIRHYFKDQNKMGDTIHFNDKKQTGSLVPCLNGSYDLSSGEFRSTKPDDHLTRYCPVMYDPDANDPNVRKFIGQITQNNKGIESFLRQLIAVALDLNIQTKTMPQLFGRTTNNGKTTFIKAVKATLGSYDLDGHGLCCEVNCSAFELGKFGTERLTPKLATIGDSRIVFVSEPNKKLKVDTGLLKVLTADGTFQSEGKFKDPNSMPTLFTIIWETNHLLEIDDPTLFARGTMQIVPFDFRVEKPDNNIDATLSSDAARSTWLNWIIEGHKEFVENNNKFSVPPVCKDLLAIYQNGQRELIPTFLDEFFEKDPSQKHYFPCRETFIEFKKWVARDGYFDVEDMQEQMFKQAAKDFIPIDTRSNLSCFIGVRKKQVPVNTPSVKSVLDQLFSREMKEAEQENAAVPVKSVLDICNQMLESNGLPDMTCWGFMDELRKRNISVVGDVNDPSLAHWRFLTEEEKANQQRKEYEARRQAHLVRLKELCKRIKTPKIVEVLNELLAELSAPATEETEDADMGLVLQILSELGTLQKAA